MSIVDIIICAVLICACALALTGYGVYFFDIKKFLFEKKYADSIRDFTPKVMIRARPYRDSRLLSDPDSIKYDVYVLNSFKAFYHYNKFTAYDSDPKALIKRTNYKEVDPFYNDIDFLIDSTYDSLNSAKERAQAIIDKINSPNIYTESAKFNSNEIKEFNQKLNNIPEDYFSD